MQASLENPNSPASTLEKQTSKTHPRAEEMMARHTRDKRAMMDFILVLWFMDRL
jgi:hypothetical protein